MQIAIKPTKKQYDAWLAISDPATKTLFYGGAAGGGKSWFGCEWLIYQSYVFPESKWYVGRDELKKITESTLITFWKVIKHHGIPKTDWKYNGQYHYLTCVPTGSRIDLLDLKYLPSDPMYERYGSTEYTGGWIEEAGEVHFDAFDTLKTRVGRHMNDVYKLPGRTLITCNPKKNWLYSMFYKPFKAGELPPNVKWIEALYSDNPHLTADYVDSLHGITNATKRERLLKGNWEYDDNPNALFDYERLEQLKTNTHIQEGAPAITADVARFGKDRTVIFGWKGRKLVEWVVIDKSSLTDVAQAIQAMRNRLNIPSYMVAIDEDGMGGGVVDMVSGATGFINNKRPLPEETGRPNYNNLKSQCFYKLAEAVNRNDYFIPNEFPHMEKLIQELEAVEIGAPDSDRKMSINSKDDIKARIGRSPDFADAMMMREYLFLYANK
jgi:phage terminase large subunit